MKYSVIQKKVLLCFREAIPSTRKSASWLLSLMIPISLCVTLLQYFGILEWIAGWINPIFVHLGLPGATAVVFLSGAMAGTYAGLAAMMSVPLTLRQATIMGIMICICHALPMECSVNKKTGSSFWKMGLIRIVMAFLCAFLLNLIMPNMNEAFIFLGEEETKPFIDVMVTWVLSQLKVCGIVLLIIYSLMFLQKLIEHFGWLNPLSEFFAPLMHVFGLPRKCAYMWLVGNVLGISYGSAVMVELKDQGLITEKDANKVNYHLIMNHSMLEDTLVFAVTGISALWIIGTRLFFAIVVVWTKILLLKLTKHKA